MISDKYKFSLGSVLLGLFVIIMVTIFSPVFGGKNALEYLDALYNSISKGSAYYVPAVAKEVQLLPAATFQVTLDLDTASRAEQSAELFRSSGVEAVSLGSNVVMSGSLAGVLSHCLEDADLMYNNKGNDIRDKYGYDERQVLFNWWNSLKALDKALTDEQLFEQAKVVALVKEKVVEPSYNYYGVVPQKITDRIGVVIFSLIFYVVYTVWYGYAIMYICEGWGLSLSH